jgi:hypothetical protein
MEMMKLEESCGARAEAPMRRSVTIGLSQFAFDALVGEGRNNMLRAQGRIESAIRFYLSDRGSGPAWPYPGFLRGSETREDVLLEVSIDGDLWASFVEEADRQEVSVQQMSEQAAFYFAAEENAGRITQRILDDLEAEGD